MEPKLGGSLAVPIVQELAKEQLTRVPARYVRPDPHPQMILSDLSSIPQIPVINMQKLSDKFSMDSELQALHDACKQWGLFQIFYGTVWRIAIYVPQLTLFEIKIANVDQPWDGGCCGGEMKDVVEVYCINRKFLPGKIVKLMAKALDMKYEEMETLFAEGMHSTRMNYYPPCPQPELVTGLCPHSDAVGLAILLQANEMEGLQIKKDGVWIPVSPLPNAFIVIVGDILEILTNGAYKSVEHRAVVNSKKERLSVATFLNPKLDVDLGPAASLVTPGTPAKFKRIGVTEYFKGYFSRELGVNHIWIS
ncbi:UNVERIFIED_CONTAM: protein SRG1 [Sesamum calycinum]|uniref:Protein SRG1 n=1 Tax=Sesamum calycinum TaxID=2727403 RepID=A0AAW2IZP9_9LAMI